MSLIRCQQCDQRRQRARGGILFQDGRSHRYYFPEICAPCWEIFEQMIDAVSPPIRQQLLHNGSNPEKRVGA